MNEIHGFLNNFYQIKFINRNSIHHLSLNLLPFFRNEQAFHRNQNPSSKQKTPYLHSSAITHLQKLPHHFTHPKGPQKNLILIISQKTTFL
jgi:hypothetical protein